MGFINDIRKIVAKLPTERQTLFFSATMPKDIADLAEQMLRNPARVAVTPVASTAERVTQRIIQVDRGSKPILLAKLLKEDAVDRSLVFTRTKHGADKVVKALIKANIPAEAIHGNKSQNHRERVLAAFRSGTIRTLVATDIAARGIDVDGISHVVNFDLPNIPETYVHRIGRTARAGADGIAISLVDADEFAYLRDIEKLIRQTLPREDMRTGEQRTHAERTGDTRNHQARSNDGRRQPAPRGNRPAGRGAPRSDDRNPSHRQSAARPQSNGARPSEPSTANGNRHQGAATQQPQRQNGAHDTHESIQGIAFMTRESRPSREPRHQQKQQKSNGRPQGVRHPQR
jgi:superfamily II DNA/RNA helicase